MKNKTTYLLLAIFMCLNVSVGLAQSKSFNKKRGTIDKAVIQAKIDSAKTIFETDPVAAITSVEEAINLAVENNHRYELAEAYFTLGIFNEAFQEYSSTVLHANRALTIYTAFNDWEKVYTCEMLLGNGYKQLSKYETAIEHFKSASTLAEKRGLIKNNLWAQFEIANVRMIQKDYDSAEKNYNSIKATASAYQFTEIVSECDLKLGEIYEQNGEWEKAANQYEEVQNTAIETKNNELLNRSNVRIVQSYSDGNDNYDQENINQTLDESGGYFTESNDTVLLLENSIQKADYYTAQGDLSGALDQLNYTYSLSEEYGDLDAQLSTSKKLFDLHAQTADSVELFNAYDNYSKLLDSVNNIKTQQQGVYSQNQFALKTIEKQIDNLEVERKLDQQTIQLLEREKELNNKALKQQKLLLYIFGFILLIFLGVSVFVYRNTKAKKRAHQLLYLKSLRAQMNPHFIFNSLNSVNNYISKSNERAANKYLSKFSKLMRQVLEYSQVEFISLTKEIDILRLYVELEHERFSDKFDFDFNVEESINTEAYDIPPMLVQPFIENAVWHGLRYKESAGMLKVHLIDKSNHVEIVVMDNGIGRSKSQELKTVNQKKHNSSGMRNVENRTEMIKAVFKTKIDYQIIDLPNHEGTKVVIKLYKNE